MKNNALILNSYRIATLMNYGYIKSEKRLCVGDCVAIMIGNRSRIFYAKVIAINKTKLIKNNGYVKKIWLKALFSTLKRGSKKA